MQKIAINAQTRRGTGKGPNRRLRAEGLVPVVVYGQGIKPLNLALNERDFLKSISKLGDELVMYNLTAQEAGLQAQLAMIRETQRDPVTERLVHIDFMCVDVSKPVDVHVAVHGHSVPVGVRDGGVLDQVLRTIHISCLPDLIPSQIDVELRDLAIGQAIHVRDLTFGEGIELLTPLTDVLFHVVLPRKVEEEVVVAAAGEAEAEGEAAPAAGEGKAEEKKKEGK